MKLYFFLKKLKGMIGDLLELKNNISTISHIGKDHIEIDENF